MAEHVLLCHEAGRVETLQVTISFLDEWLAKSGTDPGCGTALLDTLGGMVVKLWRRFANQSMKNTRSWHSSKTNWAGGGL